MSSGVVRFPLSSTCVCWCACKVPLHPPQRSSNSNAHGSATFAQLSHHSQPLQSRSQFSATRPPPPPSPSARTSGGSTGGEEKEAYQPTDVDLAFAARALLSLITPVTVTMCLTALCVVNLTSPNDSSSGNGLKSVSIPILILSICLPIYLSLSIYLSIYLYLSTLACARGSSFTEMLVSCCPAVVHI